VSRVAQCKLREGKYAVRFVQILIHAIIAREEVIVHFHPSTFSVAPAENRVAILQRGMIYGRTKSTQTLGVMNA